MWPLLVVAFDPEIEIVLQLLDRGIKLLAEGDAVELVKDGLVEALSDTIRLRALRLGPRMVDILDREIKLVVVMLGIAEYSVPRSVNTRESLTSFSSKKGTTRSFKRSAAVMAVLRS